jgi:predicted nucleic acid-binding protein
MDLVVDANILFAALIKDGATAGLLYLDDLHLFAPEFLLDEFAKYKELIGEKTSRSSEDFNKVLKVFSNRIYFVPREEIDVFMNSAKGISPDPDDAVYFAVALRVGASIWSNDSRLKDQDKVPIYTTSELIKMFSSELEDN